MGTGGELASGSQSTGELSAGTTTETTAES
jgi:hypothetical protein